MPKKIPDIQIEDNVPVPERRKLPVDLKMLEVNQSTLFPIEDRSRMQISASRLKNKTNKEFTIRKTDEGLCRVWRIK